MNIKRNEMKTCVGCKYADWQRTSIGRLHPGGIGQCKYPYKIPPLPASMYWFHEDKTPCGGFINRKNDLKDHCLYYVRD